MSWAERSGRRVELGDVPFGCRQPIRRVEQFDDLRPIGVDIEIDTDGLDEIEYEGTHMDVGEAVAQSLALAIDPFLTGPAAEAARERLRDQSASPFAVLLRRDNP